MSLGVYIQVPFCQTRCTYWNFHTGLLPANATSPTPTPCRAKFARHLNRSLRCLQARRWTRVYFGEGTPKRLRAVSAEANPRRAQVERNLGVGEDGLEITLEADPETITRDKAHTWLEAKFNRISLGVQSFVDTELQAAGRMHRRGDIYSANEILRSTGLSNISMDLIAGLAHQSAASWSASIEELIAIAPEHISIYMLEIDEGSRLGKETLAGGSRYSAGALPTPDESSDFYELACTRLAQAGYEHYEISNWAKPGFRSRHNLKYWQRVPYLGFGVGAHSFDGQNRWANIHDSVEYVRRIEQGISVREQQEVVTPLQALEEEVFLASASSMASTSPALSAR